MDLLVCYVEGLMIAYSIALIRISYNFIVILSLPVTANKAPGQYLIIDANCTNNSFARVSWYPSSLLKVNKVTIEYDCLNTSASNRLVSWLFT